VAANPTIHIVASDANRNGKTLLARLISDYLLLEGRDPLLIDTDAPEAPLRQYFPGRTVLADLGKTQGEMKTLDTIIASPGRDYVIDLPLRHLQAFFRTLRTLDFFKAARGAGFRVFVYFIVDAQASSLRAARELDEEMRPDLFIPVRNEFVGSSWPADEPAIILPALKREVALRIGDRRFALGKFVLGERQGLNDAETMDLNRFLVTALDGINRVEVTFSLKGLKA